VEDNLLEKVLGVQAHLDRARNDLERHADRINTLTEEKRHELDETYKYVKNTNHGLRVEVVSELDKVKNELSSRTS